MLKKFHSFVFLEDQDYWMYQELSAYDIKLAKGTSEKERKYGNPQLPKSNDDNNYVYQL